MTLLLFIVTLSLLILVHEWGHFFAARRLGIRVDEFGFGFPPNIVSTIKNGTKFVLNLFPIGGYVKIYGEEGEGAKERESFASRPVWQRMVVVSAGVCMNIVLAWFLFSVAHGIGIVQAVDDRSLPDARITIIGVEHASPAEIAGIRFGDSVKELRTKNLELRIHSIEEFQGLIKEYAGEEITLVLLRGGKERTITATPRTNPPEGSGALGIALEYVQTIQTPWYRAPYEGLKSTYFATIHTFSGFGAVLKNIATRGKIPSEVSGPVGIFRFAGDIQELGASYILQFIAILSINLAILNFLPIPALDGGRIFFMIVEKVRRKPIPLRFESAAHALGFAVLILLMILITIRDVHNLF